ncbi:MAG: enoyl-CoA hydratase/isomerase family protein [Planctomycetes bacterium]|nr:enoyl-CoA hydratase/isomerase family protein [Planctomycetota bacterium]
MGYESIDFGIAGGVATLTLRRPPLNVFNIAMMGEITDAFSNGLAPRNDWKALVIRAEGKAFSAGVDVGEHLGDTGRRMIDVFHRIFRMLNDVPLPIVAAVEGAALGGGCELVSMCDFVVASRTATFGQPEIKLGVFPPVAAVVFRRKLAANDALDLLLTGRTVDAVEAQRMGIVTRIVEPGKVDAECATLCAEFCKLSRAALRATKQAYRSREGDDFGFDLRAVEKRYLRHLFSSPDAEEGLKSFLEKRPPRWRDE